MASTGETSPSYASEILRACVAGSSFGAALTMARVYFPGVIIDQMRMKDFHMLEVFLSATSLSSLVFLSLEKLGISRRVTRANSTLAIFQTNLSRYDGNILGGALIGTGMALAGACPGTVIIQLAQGLQVARVTTLGAILGGVAWVLTGDRVVRSSSPASPTSSKPTKSVGSKTPSTSDKPARQSTEVRTTIPEALGLGQTTTYISFLLLMSGTIAASVTFFPGKTQAVIPTIAAGSLVAIAQAISLTIASTPLGTSATYEQIGRYIASFGQNVLGSSSSKPKQRIETPAFPPKSIIFTTGMVLGSILASKYADILTTYLNSLPLFRELPTSTSALAIPDGFVTGAHISSTQALIGGFVLAYGARMAGGCTSGHGISGLSSLSWASLISVMSMFGGGIAVRLGLDAVGL